jgi:hypothetical protein
LTEPICGQNVLPSSQNPPGAKPGDMDQFPEILATDETRLKHGQNNEDLRFMIRVQSVLLTLRIFARRADF